MRLDEKSPRVFTHPRPNSDIGVALHSTSDDTRSPRAKHDDQVDSLTQAITWMHGATQAVSDR